MSYVVNNECYEMMTAIHDNNDQASGIFPCNGKDGDINNIKRSNPLRLS